MRSSSFIISILSIAIILTSCAPKSENTENTEIARQPASTEQPGIYNKIKLTGLDGKLIDISAYKGKTVFLNLWATWCGPCVKEMPSIQKASILLKDDNIKILLASDETMERIEKFVATKDLALDFIQIESMDALNVQALPTTVIINPDGEVVFSEMGIREWDSPANIELIRSFTGEK